MLWICENCTVEDGNYLMADGITMAALDELEKLAQSK
jgi:hypothetical protein